MTKQKRARAYSILGAEFLFILLPFVVSAVVFSYKGDYLHLLHMPEWSIAASLLIGQSLVKFVSGIIANRTAYDAYWDRVALGLSFLIVVGLVPSLLILALVLVSEKISFALAISQIISFAFGVALFFAFGGGGEALLRIGGDSKHS